MKGNVVVDPSLIDTHFVSDDNSVKYPILAMVRLSEELYKLSVGKYPAEATIGSHSSTDKEVVTALTLITE